MAFQMGDKVRVTKTMPDHPCWLVEMDEWVGIVGIITDAYETGGKGTVCVRSVAMNDWWYFPTECLELVAAEPTPQELTITEPLQSWERF